MLGRVPARLLTLFTLATSLCADLRRGSSTFCQAGTVERWKNTEHGDRCNVGILCERGKVFPGELGPAQNLVFLGL